MGPPHAEDPWHPESRPTFARPALTKRKDLLMQPLTDRDLDVPAELNSYSASCL